MHASGLGVGARQGDDSSGPILAHTAGRRSGASKGQGRRRSSSPLTKLSKLVGPETLVHDTKVEESESELTRAVIGKVSACMGQSIDVHSWSGRLDFTSFQLKPVARDQDQLEKRIVLIFHQREFVSLFRGCTFIPVFLSIDSAADLVLFHKILTKSESFPRLDSIQTCHTISILAGESNQAFYEVCDNFGVASLLFGDCYLFTP